MMIVLMTMSGTAVNKLRVSWGCALDHLAALPVYSTLEHGGSSACSPMSRWTSRLNVRIRILTRENVLRITVRTLAIKLTDLALTLVLS